MLHATLMQNKVAACSKPIRKMKIKKMSIVVSKLDINLKQYSLLIQEYGECSCISPTLVNEHIHHLNWSTKLLENMKTPTAAVIGSCDRDCKNLIPFLCGIVVLLVLNFVNAVPTKMVVMRYVKISCVELKFNQKSSLIN